MPELFTDYVFSLSAEDFTALKHAVTIRIDKERYGVTDFEELAILYDRIPSCPVCGSCDYISYGVTPQGKIRFECKDCGRIYNLISNTIFHSTNKSFDTWAGYLVLMSFNVPLEMCEEICDISHPTAML